MERQFVEIEAELSSFCSQEVRSCEGQRRLASTQHPLPLPHTHTHIAAYPVLTACSPGALPVVMLHPSSTSPWVHVVNFLVGAGERHRVSW